MSVSDSFFAASSDVTVYATHVPSGLTRGSPTVFSEKMSSGRRTRLSWAANGDAAASTDAPATAMAAAEAQRIMAIQYMTGPAYRYRSDVLDALASHGVRPRGDTAPAAVREFLNDLYRYELRVLRDRLLRGEFAKSALAGRVIELRRRYPLLSLPVDRWTDDGG